MDEWLVGVALALIGIAYIVWDIRNSLKPRRGSGDGGGSDGSDSDSSADGSGGDGD
jgi:hypothetical protein